ncbi:hypothetical protein TNCT_165461 [Trichonephila clavata]|uniref:Uncharacterized protein n=1 Tax=Trichonephila clavata TaxID=2740835 RepID=A0A8X6FM06_TRICU|nr:hypothetical protein TNCT_165461 [Trichonephila clavata]
MQALTCSDNKNNPIFDQLAQWERQYWSDSSEKAKTRRADPPRRIGFTSSGFLHILTLKAMRLQTLCPKVGLGTIRYHLHLIAISCSFPEQSAKTKLLRMFHHHTTGISNRPGGSLTLSCNEQDQTTFTHFLIGHLRSLTHPDGVKSYAVCTKCTTVLASLEHILKYNIS